MMDKNLHDDIGDLFNDNIEPLNQPPRKEVWDLLEQQLDKKDASQYKKKFLVTRRLAAVLILLLLCFATCTYVYFNTQRNDNGNSNTTAGNKNEGEQKNNQAINNMQRQNNINAADSVAAIKKEYAEKPAAEGFAKNDNPGKENKEIAAFNESIKKYSNNVNKPVPPIFENSNLYNNPITGTGRHITSSKNNTGVQRENVFNDTAVDKSLFANQLPQLQQPVTPDNSIPAIITNANDTSGIVKIQQQPLPVNLVNDSLSGIANKKAIKKISIQNPLSSRLSVTVFAAPEKVGYHLQNDAINPYDNKQLIKNRERPDLSFSAGILLGYHLTKHLTLQSGISFSSANTNIAPSVIYAEKNTAGSIKYRYNTSSGYGYIFPSFTNIINVGDSINATRADQTIQYINIPLVVKYRLGKKRFSINAGAGISFNFLSKATLNTGIINNQTQEKESISKLTGLKKISYSLALVPELDYKLSKNFSLSASPYFKFSPEPVNKGNIVKTYPYNFGFGLGVTYRF